jgi:hypothetical protein
MLTNFVGEDRLVVEEALYPVHECIHVIGRRQLGWSLVCHTVFPKVFIPRSRRHDWTLQDVNRRESRDIDGTARWDIADLLRSAKFSYGAVQHVEVIEEIDGWESNGSLRVKT